MDRKGLVAWKRKADAPALARVGMWLAMARGNPAEAAYLAEASGESDTIVTVAKTAVGAGTTISPDYAALTDAARISAAYVSSLARSSIFYRMMSDGLLTEAPFLSRLIWMTLGITAHSTGEAQPIPLARLQLASGDDFASELVAAMIVISNELAKSGGAAAEAVIERELRRGISFEADTKFFGHIIDGDTPTNQATGTGDASDAATDLAMLLADVAPTAESRLIWAMAPDVARRASALKTETGGFLFPGFTPTGGQIQGVPAMATAALDEGQLALIDGDAIVAGSDVFAVSVSSEGAVEMNDAPTQDGAAGTGSNLVSLWQNDLIGIKARTYLTARRTRENAVALMEGVAWGGAIPAS